MRRSLAAVLLSIGIVSLTRCGSPIQSASTPDEVSHVAAVVTAPAAKRASVQTEAAAASATQLATPTYPLLLWRPGRPTRGSSAAPNPTFTSTPRASAAEGTAYSYTMAATDPAGGTITYGVIGPEGATVSGNVLSWTPTPAQSRIVNPFVVTATTASGGFATQLFSVTPAGTVDGSRIITHYEDSGITYAPAADLSTMTIAAYVSDDNGGFTLRPGTADTTGNFSIPGIPQGAYWLQLGTSWIWTDRTTIDAGYAVQGRPDAVFASAGTQTAFNLSGMVPCSPDSDEIDWVVTNAGGYGTYFPYLLNPGTTWLTLTDSYRGFLADAAKGDKALVTQLSSTTKVVAGQIYPIAVLKKVYGPVSITQVNGTTTPVTGSFSDPTRFGTYRLNVQGSAFAAIALAAHPSAQLDLGDFYLLEEPDPSVGSIANATVMEFIGCGGACAAADRIDTDIDFGDVTYGNPFPQSWQPAGLFFEGVAKTYALGSTRPYTAYGDVETVTLTQPTATEPFQPVIGTVTNPTINGADFFQDRTGVGPNPTLAWSEPALGMANEYMIFVFKLSIGGSGVTAYTKASRVATLYTTSSPITLPPGMLTNGNSYYFLIYAVREGDLDLTAAPFRRSMPEGKAAVYSGMITP